MRTFDGLYDSFGHRPNAPMEFHAMELSQPLDVKGWRCDAVYVHDANGPDGAEGITDNTLRKVRDALRDLTAGASDRLLIWPEGRDDGRSRSRHVLGGGWHVNGSGVVFYAVGSMDADGCWRKYLCANV